MNADMLLKHFDRISEAPDAVTRLRRFILDLAVRGKLVEQDSKGEPAAVLMKRIAVEKEYLVKNGKAKKEKPLPPLQKEEIPYAVPEAWEWVRIRQVTSDRGQIIPKENFTYIDVTAINKEAGCIADARVMTPSEAPSRARKVVCAGDVIYSCVRPYLLNIAVVGSGIEPAPIASTAFAILNGFGLVLSQYLWITLRSPFFIECVEEKMRGQAYPAINDSDFALLPLPLPPLKEQHRIVAKVEELMALCDQLQAARDEREAQRDRLVAASLHRIGIAPATVAEADGHPAIDLQEAARFHLDHLPRLATRPGHIKQLRQTILNLAVCGGFSAKAKWPNEPRVLGEVAKLQNGYAFKSEWFCAAGVRLLRNANIGHGVIGWGDVVNLPEDRIQEFERFRLFENDIVLSLDRPFIATGVKVARIRAEDLPCLLLQRVGRFQFADPLCRDYLFLWLHSSHFTTQINPGRSNGVPHISSKQVEAAMIYIPPIPEQYRIVAKVNELMAVCGQLEAQLAITEADSRRLLEAVLRDALAPTASLAIAA